MHAFSETKLHCSEINKQSECKDLSVLERIPQAINFIKKQEKFEKAKVKGVNDSFEKEYKKLEKKYKPNKQGTKAKVKRRFPYMGPGTTIIRDDGTATFYSDTPEGKALYKKENPEGFNVGGHSVMGSPINVDVDGDTLSNPSASAYYKDLLK